MSRRKTTIVIAALCAMIIALIGALIGMKVNESHYKMYKNIISQDEVEQTLFGQPISQARNGTYRIGIKTAIDGDFHVRQWMMTRGSGNTGKRRKERQTAVSRFIGLIRKRASVCCVQRLDAFLPFREDALILPSGTVGVFRSGAAKTRGGLVCPAHHSFCFFR